MSDDKRQGEEKVVELLKKAYSDELETVINYLSHSVRLETFDGHDIAEELLKDVQNESDHAERLGERIKILGSEPPTSLDIKEQFDQDELNHIEDTSDVLSVIDGVIAAEKEAVNVYRELIRTARQAEDYGTARLAEELLQDEEEHLQEFKEIRSDFNED